MDRRWPRCSLQGAKWPLNPHTILYHLIYSICTLLSVDTLDLGTDLPGALELYKSKCACLGALIDSARLVMFSEFFFTTFFRHYRLYQYASSTEQEPLHSSLWLSIHTPPDCLPQISDGVAPDVWEYQQVLLHISLSVQFIPCF